MSGQPEPLETAATARAALDGDTASAAGESDTATWEAFLTASSPVEYFGSWLALQCRMIVGVQGGLVLVKHTDGRFRPASAWPAKFVEVAQLGEVAERTIKERRGVVQNVQAARSGARPDDDRAIIGYPIDVEGDVRAVVVLDATGLAARQLQTTLRSLHWGTGWLRRVLGAEDSGATAATATAAVQPPAAPLGGVTLDIVGAVVEHKTFQASAMVLVNELSRQLACERVSFGLRKGRRVSLRALSNSAWFQKRSEMVRVLERAMEEAVDQGGPVAWSAGGGASDRGINLANGQLGSKAGLTAVLSVPIKANGRVVCALTLERTQPPAFSADEQALAELVGLLAAPFLKLQLANERPVSGKLLSGAGRGLRGVVGPKRAGLKLMVIVVLAAVTALAFVQGNFRVSARTVLEGSVQRAAVAPFEGFVREALARAGDIVVEGQLLARLDDTSLRLEVQNWRGQLVELEQREREAQAEHDRAAIQLVAAQLAQAAAELALAEAKLSQTEVVAPIDGVIITGDLSQQLGAPVERGAVLFEVAPLDSYRAILEVSERDIGNISVGASGTLTLTGAVGIALPFEVTNITSVSTPVDGENVFRVEAALTDGPAQLLPGMEGVAKVNIERRSLLWIWTHGLVDRLRLWAWTWLP